MTVGARPGHAHADRVAELPARDGHRLPRHAARWRRLSCQRRLPANCDQPLGQGRRSRRPARRPAEVRGRPAGNPGPHRRPRSSRCRHDRPVPGRRDGADPSARRQRPGALTAFYHDVLGATVTREYGGSSCVLRFLGTWLLLVTAGPPTDDKPTVTFAPPRRPRSRRPRADDPGSRLPGRPCHADRSGAIFLAPPSELAWEIRAFFRDPDGHLIEISEAK